MTDFWIISAPGDPTCQQTWEKLNNATSRQTDLSTNYKLHIPDFKVGTLDQLVGLTDDLGKLDIYAESVSRKVASYLSDVLEDKRDKLSENLRVNNMDIKVYACQFQWDFAKYPIKLSLRGLSDIISKQLSQIENDLKSKSNIYNTLKSNLTNLERKATGSLLTRNLGDLVKKEHFVLGSEYMTTMLVVVPKAIYKDWELRYEKLTDMVVPKSSRKIYEDEDSGLFTVTLFRKVCDEFKQKARENKFIVRDFVYDEAELAAGKNELSKLANDKKRQYGPLVRWLQVNFGEAFMAWIHVKVLRVFVESVLRYGLPVNFQGMLLHPKRKELKRLRQTLLHLYGSLDASSGGDLESSAEAAAIGLMGLPSDYFPYVSYNLNLDFVKKDSAGNPVH